MNSISADLNIMIKASEKASKALIRDFGELEKLQVSSKGPSNFVTNADVKAEKIIIEELIKSKRNYSIISEESENKIGNDKDNVWIIDPIDGTTNFLHGVPHFAISIALKSKNEIVSGLIYDPIKDEMFYAEKNYGAYCNNQRIRVSNKKNLENCLFATGGNLNIWDIAAGIVLVKEAGGIINNFDIRKEENIKVLASSSEINDKLIQNLINF